LKNGTKVLALMAPRDIERVQHVPQRREPARKRRHRVCPTDRLDRTAGRTAYFRHEPLIHRPFERPLPGRTENGRAIAPEWPAAEHFLDADCGVALPPSVHVEDAVVPADVESPDAENRAIAQIGQASASADSSRWSKC
jgi:hypothetical protein